MSWENILPNIKNDIGFQVHKIFLPFLANWNHAFHFEKLTNFCWRNTVQYMLYWNLYSVKTS